MFYFSYLKVTA